VVKPTSCGTLSYYSSSSTYGTAGTIAPTSKYTPEGAYYLDSASVAMGLSISNETGDCKGTITIPATVNVQTLSSITVYFTPSSSNYQTPAGVSVSHTINAKDTSFAYESSYSYEYGQTHQIPLKTLPETTGKYSITSTSIEGVSINENTGVITVGASASVTTTTTTISVKFVPTSANYKDSTTSFSLEIKKATISIADVYQQYTFDNNAHEYSLATFLPSNLTSVGTFSAKSNTFLPSNVTIESNNTLKFSNAYYSGSQTKIELT
jgi:hypothetical protein